MTYFTPRKVRETFIAGGLAIALFAVSGGFSAGAAVPAVRNADVSVPQACAEVPKACLIIPSIGVNAVINEVGVTSAGAMAVPGNRIDVGWYRFGTRPGEAGSAVIAGHNYWDSGEAVFSHLHELRVGDAVSVVDSKGVSTSFVVHGMRTYDATDTNTGIFGSDSGAHLNLVTCTGDRDSETGRYSERLVVFTDAV